MNIIIFLSLFLSLAFARGFTPSQMAEMAESRAPLIKMQIEERSAANSQVSQSRLLANPMLVSQFGTLRAGGANGGIVDVSLNQPVPWPGKRFAEINSAKILEKISEADLAESKLLVNHSVSLLSLELAVLTELERHNQERKKRFSIINQYLTSRPQISPQQVVQRNMIDAQLRFLESQMFDLETKKVSLENHLTRLSGEEKLKIIVDWKKIFAPGPKEFFMAELDNSPRIKKAQRLEPALSSTSICFTPRSRTKICEPTIAPLPERSL